MVSVYVTQPGTNVNAEVIAPFKLDPKQKQGIFLNGYISTLENEVQMWEKLMPLSFEYDRAAKTLKYTAFINTSYSTDSNYWLLAGYYYALLNDVSRTVRALSITQPRGGHEIHDLLSIHEFMDVMAQVTTQITRLMQRRFDSGTLTFNESIYTLGDFPRSRIPLATRLRNQNHYFQDFGAHLPDPITKTPIRVNQMHWFAFWEAMALKNISGIIWLYYEKMGLDQQGQITASSLQNLLSTMIARLHFNSTNLFINANVYNLMAAIIVSCSLFSLLRNYLNKDNFMHNYNYMIQSEHEAEDAYKLFDNIYNNYSKGAHWMRAAGGEPIYALPVCNTMQNPGFVHLIDLGFNDARIEVDPITTYSPVNATPQYTILPAKGAYFDFISGLNGDFNPKTCEIASIEQIVPSVIGYVYNQRRVHVSDEFRRVRFTRWILPAFGANQALLLGLQLPISLFFGFDSMLSRDAFPFTPTTIRCDTSNIYGPLRKDEKAPDFTITMNDGFNWLSDKKVEKMVDDVKLLSDIYSRMKPFIEEASLRRHEAETQESTTVTPTPNNEGPTEKEGN